MQTPLAHPSQVTLSNLVKVPHVFSHHANSKPSVQRCDHTPLTTTDRRTDLSPDQTIRLLLNQDQTMIADLQHTKLALSTTESRHKTTLQTNFIQQYKPKMSSKQ
jgi:hypothetical protein